jgi:Protein of unknown function (DUF998)
MMPRKALLLCGILSSLLYVVTVALAPLGWEGYNSASQTVSELIAIDAPTSPIVVPLFVVYSLLIYGFGAGVWASSGPKLALRFTAIGLIGKEVLGLAATLFFPMHLREVIAGGGGTSTEFMHVTFTFIGVLFMMLAIGSAAFASGKRFRLYSIATILLLVGGGILTGLDVPRLDANLPTPWMGVWERGTIYAYMLWVAVLSIVLLRVEGERRGFERGS